MAEKNSKKRQEWYKRNYGKHVRFGPRIAAGDYWFVERPPVMSSATDQMAYKGYLKLLHRRTGPYRIISIEREYAMIHLDSIRNTASINRLSKVAKETKPKMEATPDPRTKHDTNSAIEALTENETSYYAVEKIVNYENQPIWT